MGFEPFPAPSPVFSLATFHSPRGFPRTRPSHPPKLFPRQQPHCVTATVAFPPFNGCLPRFPSTPKCFWSPLPTCNPLLCTHVATSAVLRAAPSPTSRPCSIVESVVQTRCCHHASTRCSLGLRSPSGPSPRPRRPFSDTPPRILCKTQASLLAVRTGLSVTFNSCIAHVEDILLCIRWPYKDLPAVGVAFIPLVSDAAKPKLRVAHTQRPMTTVPKHNLHRSTGCPKQNRIHQPNPPR
jgi:hypothetical protein